MHSGEPSSQADRYKKIEYLQEITRELNKLFYEVDTFYTKNNQHLSVDETIKKLPSIQKIIKKAEHYLLALNAEKFKSKVKQDCEDSLERLKDTHVELCRSCLASKSFPASIFYQYILLELSAPIEIKTFTEASFNSGSLNHFADRRALISQAQACFRNKLLHLSPDKKEAKKVLRIQLDRIAEVDQIIDKHANHLAKSIPDLITKANQLKKDVEAASFTNPGSLLKVAVYFDSINPSFSFYYPLFRNPSFLNSQHVYHSNKYKALADRFQAIVKNLTATLHLYTEKLHELREYINNRFDLGEQKLSINKIKILNEIDESIYKIHSSFFSPTLSREMKSSDQSTFSHGIVVNQSQELIQAIEGPLTIVNRRFQARAKQFIAGEYKQYQIAIEQCQKELTANEIEMKVVKESMRDYAEVKQSLQKAAVLLAPPHITEEQRYAFILLQSTQDLFNKADQAIVASRVQRLKSVNLFLTQLNADLSRKNLTVEKVTPETKVHFENDLNIKDQQLAKVEALIKRIPDPNLTKSSEEDVARLKDLLFSIRKKLQEPLLIKEPELNAFWSPTLFSKEDNSSNNDKNSKPDLQQPIPDIIKSENTLSL